VKLSATVKEAVADDEVEISQEEAANTLPPLSIFGWQPFAVSRTRRLMPGC
jgi:hypothetical protein